MACIISAKYGKDKVRVFRVVREQDGKHDIVEYIVTALLEGVINTSFTESDNSCIVATDSIKNTIYLFAKQSPHVLQPETFALDLGIHFVSTYSHIHKANIDIVQLKWSRIPVAGSPHKHSFVRDGEDKRFTTVVVEASERKDKVSAKVSSGIRDLLVLKTTESSFEDFVRDQYTTLPEVNDRIFSTAVDCSYDLVLPSTTLSQTLLPQLGVNFDEMYQSVLTTTLEVFATHNSASVQATLYKMCEKILADNVLVSEVTYRLPNKHYFAVDMTYFDGLKNTAPEDAEVFMPVDAPSGLIVATVGRAPASTA